MATTSTPTHQVPVHSVSVMLAQPLLLVLHLLQSGAGNARISCLTSIVPTTDFSITSLLLAQLLITVLGFLKAAMHLKVKDNVFPSTLLLNPLIIIMVT